MSPPGNGIGRTLRLAIGSICALSGTLKRRSRISRTNGYPSLDLIACTSCEIGIPRSAGRIHQTPEEVKKFVILPNPLAMEGINTAVEGYL
jgi:hypothetical protein